MELFERLNQRMADKIKMVAQDQSLPGRKEVMAISGVHSVLGSSMVPPFPSKVERLIVGMGCFWGAERVFWSLPGVYTTAVGYCAGYTPNPTYEEVCSGNTGHNEVVMIAYDRELIGLEKLLAQFWESHDPTQVMRQGNDIGTQYRSGLYVFSEQQLAICQHSREVYQRRLDESGYGEICTELALVESFFYAEEYHQQYLHKNPNGYCGLGGTGVACPVT